MLAKAQIARRRRGNPVSRYLRETVAELRKVTWPTRPDALRLTGLVLVVVVISSAVLGLLDYLFAQLVRFIITLG
ncbi:MAG: preprotein translocase subunit SecE [Anaerolineales bacterium]